MATAADNVGTGEGAARLNEKRRFVVVVYESNKGLYRPIIAHDENIWVQEDHPLHITVTLLECLAEYFSHDGGSGGA